MVNSILFFFIPLGFIFLVFIFLKFVYRRTSTKRNSTFKTNLNFNYPEYDPNRLIAPVRANRLIDPLVITYIRHCEKNKKGAKNE